MSVILIGLFIMMRWNVGVAYKLFDFGIIESISMYHVEINDRYSKSDK